MKYTYLYECPDCNNKGDYCDHMRQRDAEEATDKAYEENCKSSDYN